MRLDKGTLRKLLDQRLRSGAIDYGTWLAASEDLRKLRVSY